MRTVRCYECGKIYNYEEDGFCPRCGAFNQPRRTTRIGTDGGVVREDGIHENNHAGSFVHQELHEEKRERRRLGLDKSVRRIQQKPRLQQQAVPQAPFGQQSRKNTPNRTTNPLTLVIWVIIVIVFVNILSRIALLF